MDLGSNVQVVVGLADLRTIFKEWMAEEEANRKKKEDREKVVSEMDVIEKYGVSRCTLWRWAQAGYLTPRKFGKANYYIQAEIDSVMERKK